MSKNKRKCYNPSNFEEKRIFESQYLLAANNNFKKANKLYHYLGGIDLMYSDIYQNNKKNFRGEYLLAEKIAKNIAQSDRTFKHGPQQYFMLVAYHLVDKQYTEETGKVLEKTLKKDNLFTERFTKALAKFKSQKNVFLQYHVDMEKSPNLYAFYDYANKEFSLQPNGYMPVSYGPISKINQKLKEKGFDKLGFGFRLSSNSKQYILTYKGKATTIYSLGERINKGNLLLSERDESDVEVEETMTTDSSKQIIETANYQKNNYLKRVDEFKNKVDQQRNKSTDDSFLFYKSMLEDQISYLYSQLKVAKKQKNQKSIVKYENLIKDRENLFDEFINGSVEESLVSTGNSQMQFVQSQLNKDNLTTSELFELMYILDLYKDITNINNTFSILNEEDFIEKEYINPDTGETETRLSEFVQKLQNLESKANELDKRVYSLSRKEVLNMAKQTFNDQNLTEDALFKSIPDISFTAQKSLDASRQGVALLSLMHNILANTQTLANQENDVMLKENEKRWKEFKQSSFYQQNGFEPFLEKNEEGTNTGNMTSAYNSSYWEEWRNAIKLLKSSKKNSFKTGQKWFNENHIYVKFFTTEKGKQNEIDRLLKLDIPEHRVYDLVNEAEEKYKEFEIQKQFYINEVESENDPITSELMIEDWLQENHPEKVLFRLFNDKSVKSLVNDKNFIKNNYNYLSYIPLKKHFNSEFDIIANDEIASDYYNFLKERFKQLHDNFPPDVLQQNEINPNSIPVLTKKFMESVRKDGTSSVLGYTMDSFNNFLRKHFTVNDNQDKAFGRLNPRTGEVKDTLPIFMLSDRNVKIENRSFELNEILNNFTMMSNQYKYKAVVETPLLLIKESLNTMNETKTSVSGSSKIVSTTNKQQEITSSSNNLNRIKDLANFQLQHFYGKGKTSTGKISTILNTKEKEKLNELEEELAELEKHLEENDIKDFTKEELLEISKKINTIKYEMEKLGVVWTVSETIRAAMKYVSLVSLGFNPNSALVESFYGIYSNLLHATGGQDFSKKQLFKSFKHVITNLLASGRTSASKKLENFMLKYDVVSELHDMHKDISRPSGKKSWKKRFGPWSMMRIADKLTKGSVALSIIDNIKITNKAGDKTVSLYEALDENAELLEEFQTEENIKNWSVTNLSSGLSTNKFLNTVNKIAQVNKMLHGNYDSKSPIMAKRDVSYEAFSQFRTWMYEGIAQRFQKEVPDHVLGRNVKGRYLTYKDVYLSEKSKVEDQSLMSQHIYASKQLALRVFNGLIFRNKPAYKGLTELEGFEDYTEANMKKNIAGLRVLILLSLILLAMKKSLTDDDEDKSSPALSFLLNQGYRLQSDIDFYSSVSQGRGILSNIFPATRILKTFGNWTDAVNAELFDESKTRFKQGPFKDNRKLGVRTLELIPFTNAGLNMYKQSSGVFQFYK